MVSLNFLKPVWAPMDYRTMLMAPFWKRFAMLLGIPGDATYANYQEANRALYRLTVLPLVAKVTAAIGHWMGDLRAEDIQLRPDLDQVPALSAERDAQWRRIAEADFLGADEKRRLLGLPRMSDQQEGQKNDL